MLLAAAATAAVKGSGYALSGFVVLFVGLWLKARLEERFLRAELGARAYDAYARRTAMLIPFVRI
jgi:protein-S-isoprenylcysteine O-methyltransferase Ste14